MENKNQDAKTYQQTATTTTTTNKNNKQTLENLNTVTTLFHEMLCVSMFQLNSLLLLMDDSAV